MINVKKRKTNRKEL